ncbi:MAG: leucine-rich repeat protein, partial [Bacteroidales bacterium]|nr:leucine-rich repeat protein [Bacteroidales bacterium]
FSGCTSLRQFTIPKNTKSIGSTTFLNCDNLSGFEIEEGNEYFTVENGILFNKDKSSVVKYPGGRKERTYTIPDGVSLIGENAFSTTKFLEEIYIPNSVSEFGYGAFEESEALAKIEIPNSVKKIGAYAFNRCSSLKNLTIPSSVTEIGGNMLSANSSLESFTLEADVESFYESFWYCTNLRDVNITSSSIEKVSLNFNDAPALISMGLSNSISSLELDFLDCPQLETINLPSSLKTIDISQGEGIKEYQIDSDNQYFATVEGVLFSKDLKDLILFPRNYSKKFVMPSNVESIGNSAFSGNKNIKEIRKNPEDCKTEYALVVNDSLRRIGNWAFSSCENLQVAELPNTVTNIGVWTFSHTKNLDNISLPVCLEKLGYYSFEKSGISSLNLPPLVNELGFYGCDTLYVSSRNPIPSTDGDYEDMILYVPNGYKNIYSSTAGWNLAKEIREVEYIWVDEILLEENQYFVDINTPLRLSASISPENASFKFIKWRCTNDSDGFVLDEFSGQFTGLKKGIYEINAYPIDGSDVDGRATICVGYSKPSEMIFSRDSITLTNGWSTQLEYSVLPENPYYSEVEWISSDNDIVEVSNGFVTANGVGSATITASIREYGINASCTVTVVPEYVKSIQLSHSEWTAEVGEELQLTASVYPTNATDTSVVWSSSDSSVATVNESGLVSAVKSGSAVITVMANDNSGVSATCNVEVLSYFIPVQSIVLNPTEWVGTENDSFRVSVTFLPEDATDKRLKWSSSNDNVACVDDEGFVSILKEGQCVITATTLDGSDVSAECLIHATSGVKDIFADVSTTVDVYTLDGVKIKSECKRSDLEDLTSGIYLLRRGNKVEKLIVR